MKSSTEQGFYSSVDADGCGLNSVTVNAAIDAWWGSGPTWNWQDLQQAFAGTLWTVMQAVGNSQNYPNYSYTAVPWGKPVALLAGIPSSSTGDTTYPQ